MSNKKYNIIYADPAWGQYKDKMHAGERGVTYKYETMSLDDVCALPVSSHAADNCHLYMWTTMPLLFDAEKVMNSWGFKYKTCAFVWIKTNPKADKAMKELNKMFKEKFENGDKVSINDLLPYLIKLCFMGNGSYSRANAEICLLGTKGRLPRQSASVRSVIFSPLGDHSAKPPEVRDRIVELVGDLPRLEMFGRGKAASGWDIWGNEAEGSIIL